MNVRGPITVTCAALVTAVPLSTAVAVTINGDGASGVHFGSLRADVISAQGGNDFVNAFRGHDIVRGDAGDDVLFGAYCCLARMGSTPSSAGPRTTQSLVDPAATLCWARRETT